MHVTKSLDLKTRDDFLGNRRRLNPRWIGGVARRPHTSLAAVDCKRAAHDQLVFDVEA
jgi:hypothetical protein